MGCAKRSSSSTASLRDNLDQKVTPLYVAGNSVNCMNFNSLEMTFVDFFKVLLHGDKLNKMKIRSQML